MNGRSTEIEIIGMISTTLASEIYGKSIITGAVDPRFIAEFARVHEEGGFDRVLQRVESTDQHGAGAGVIVVKQRVGDLLRRPHQRRGAAGRAGRGGDRGPQTLVVDLALRGEIEEPLRADALRPRRGLRAAA